MEITQELSAALDLIIRPAFAVSDGIIQYCNRAACQCMFCTGTPVSPLLETGKEEYPAFTGGSLYLTLQLDGQFFGATVSRVSGFDVFVLDREDSQLQALALAARELREPLSEIMIASERLLPPEGSADPNHQLLQRSLYHMLRLVGNMSDAARYAAQTSPRQQLQNIPALLSDIFDKAAALATHAGITLRFTNYPQSVISLADTEKLERAVYNIVSNAIKFSHPGDTIEATLTRHGNQLRLTVCDNGSGIPDEILGSVFSRHLRQPCVEERRQGIGLGMFIIRSAASAHGGTVLLERGAEKGTRLTMTLAIRKDLSGNLSAPRLVFDYAGELDHGLIELADVLPYSAFRPNE